MCIIAVSLRVALSRRCTSEALTQNDSHQTWHRLVDFTRPLHPAPPRPRWHLSPRRKGALLIRRLHSKVGVLSTEFNMGPRWTERAGCKKIRNSFGRHKWKLPNATRALSSSAARGKDGRWWQPHLTTESNICEFYSWKFHGEGEASSHVGSRQDGSKFCMGAKSEIKMVAIQQTQKEKSSFECKIVVGKSTARR